MPDRLLAFLHRELFGASGLQWFIALLIVFGVTPLLILARGLVAQRLRRLTERSRIQFDDFLVTLVERTRGWFLAVLALRAASLVFDLPERWDSRAQAALVVFGMIQGGVWAVALVRYLVDIRFVRHVETKGQVVPVAQTLLRFAGLVVVWTLVLLAVLSSFGIDITARVAGLGVGGVAVALAVQTLLGDVLASISIAMDKPFSPGDYIVVGQDQGTVRRISLRSTVLGGLGGEEIVIANNDLLSSRISNYTRMFERRVKFSVGVLYDTSQELLEALPGLLRSTIDGREKVRFDRATLMNLADSAIQYEVVYWVLDPGYAVYAEIHQRILLDLIRDMRAAGYDFAFPSRTLYMGSPLTLAEPTPKSRPEPRAHLEAEPDTTL
jgi:small-conductance mechanosensitive channel